MAVRRRRLRACLRQLRDPLPPTSEVAARVLANMVMSVDQQAAELGGAGLTRVLKRPLPYDSSNPHKPALMIELMPSVGADKLADKVWGHLASAFKNTPQATPFVLVTGVSGMGKTKVAYDIGRTEVFVVVDRVVEHDALTPPWEAFRTFAVEVTRTAAPTEAAAAASHNPLPLEERVTLKAALIVLLGAHLEWAVQVSEAAVGASCAAALDAACSGSPDARVRLLRELVLRAQRNGLAYVHVAALFRNKMCDLLDAPNTIGEDSGKLQLSVESVLSYLESVTTRARAVWGRRRDDGTIAAPHIVWAHDEVQALLSVSGLPRDLFDGVYASSEAATTSPPGDYRGCFYGLLAAARDVTKHVNSGHLLLGNSMDLSSHVLGRFSPAQGVAKSVEEAFNLSADDIRGWLGAYLTPEAMAGADAELLEQLRGRALFASHFWTALLCHCSSSATAADDPAKAVRGALKAAAASATMDAELRIRVLWDRHSPDAVSGQVPSRLLRHLFHELVMAAGTDNAALDTARMRAELVEAIQRGVLNAKANSSAIQLDAEPCTAAALRTVGMNRLACGTDGVMELLAARMTEPPGGEDADLGAAQEACFAWQLVRQCLTWNSPRMTLGELLAPYLARVESTMDVRGNVHPAVLPSVCDDYEVALTRGCRADGAAWKDRCPLGLLGTTPDALVHHTSPRMGGPDIIFLARHRVTGDTRPVLLQLKNRATDSLAAALPSLDMAKWYRESSIASELPAHASMRAVLVAHPQWALPIRVVVGARPVDAGVLLSTAWLNKAELKGSPVLFLRLTRENLRVDIAPRGAINPYHTTHEWPQCLWPTPVTRNWDARLPALPALLPCPAAPVFASLQVKLTSKASKNAMVAMMRHLALGAGNEFDCVRHRKFLSRWNTITVTFTRAASAFDAFQLGAEGELKADGHAVTAAFV